MRSNTMKQKQTELFKKLRSQNVDEIRSAAFEAAELGLSEAIPMLIEHLQSPNVGVQEAAEYALRKIRGAEAVTYIAPLLRSEDVGLRNNAMDILREIGSDDLNILYELLHDRNVDIRIFITDILGSSGATFALGMLMDVLEKDLDINVRYQACISLGSLGYAQAKEALGNALKNDEEWVQFAAVEALIKLKADDCIDTLLAVLPTSSELVACTIINALGAIGNISSVPILLQRLDKNSGPLRNAAVKAIIQIIGAPSLGLLGEKELEKLHTYLLIALEDEDEDVVLAALAGLSFFCSVDTAKAVFERIQKMDPARNVELLSAAVRCLVDIGYNDALKQAIFSTNEVMVRAAIEVCGLLGCRRCVGLLITAFWSLPIDMQETLIHYLVTIADATDASFFIELLEKHKDPFIIEEALLFLGERASCSSISSELFRFLYYPDPKIRETALQACLALKDTFVNQKIIDLFSHEESSFRRMAIYAMGKIDAETYLDSLLVALKDTSPEVRKTALEFLEPLCESRPELFITVSVCRNDESKDVRLALVELARKLNTPESLSLIITMLEDNDTWVRIRAIEALADYKEEIAVAAIIQRLEGDNLLVTMKIIETLGVIGGKIAFQALLGLTNHENPEIQQAVSHALCSIREEQGEDF